MALSEATKEAIWLKTFASELGEISHDDSILVFEDNQGSIALAKNPELHKRTNHIDIRYHFVSEKIEDGHIVLEYCPTQDMLADIMTKAILADQFTKFATSWVSKVLPRRVGVLERKYLGQQATN